MLTITTNTLISWFNLPPNNKEEKFPILCSQTANNLVFAHIIQIKWLCENKTKKITLKTNNEQMNKWIKTKKHNIISEIK